MEAILRYNLPEDRHEFSTAINSQKFAASLFEISSNLRRRVEYKIEFLSSPLESDSDVIDMVCKEIAAILDECGVKEDELI